MKESIFRLRERKKPWWRGKDLVVEKEMFSAEKSFLLTPAGTRSGLRYTGDHTLPRFTAVKHLSCCSGHAQP